ncbi:hypothetical protein NIES2101_07865 [Calothrix sp. HK-06]|nr:hypothetical protein NIES2101_07865 [Calothrix sp. HK-06]
MVVGTKEPSDPPPDLVIESDVTSKTTIEAYESVGVPEIWIYDSGELTIYLLLQGKKYTKSETSPTFPQIPITELIPQLLEKNW